MVPPSSGIARCVARKCRVNFLEFEPWPEQERDYSFCLSRVVLATSSSDGASPEAVWRSAVSSWLR
jgi:hypothetical protein